MARILYEKRELSYAAQPFFGVAQKAFFTGQQL